MFFLNVYNQKLQILSFVKPGFAVNYFEFNCIDTEVTYNKELNIFKYKQKIILKLKAFMKYFCFDSS